VTATRRSAVAAIVVSLAVVGAGYTIDAAGNHRQVTALGPDDVTVEMDIEHSRFLPSRLRVRAGTVVRFVVDNRDPIHHELIVGPARIHDQHETGTELRHPPVPGEVSVDPNGSGMTFYTFDEPGTVAFACHLPGHVAYGMVGEIEVVE
jgi:uncharacterized cupredoxin-like copper-binding protein